MAHLVTAASECYPTRNGTCQVLFTWSRFYSCSVQYLLMYETDSRPPYSRSFNADTDWSDPFGYGAREISQEDAPEGGVYRTWVTARGQWVWFCVVYRDPDTKRWWCLWTSPSGPAENVLGLARPNLAYNAAAGKLVLSGSFDGAAVIEFERTDTGYGAPAGISDDDAAGEFLFAALVNLEGGSGPADMFKGYAALHRDPQYPQQPVHLTRWPPGHYAVGVSFRSDNNKSEILSGIQAALSAINGVLNGYGVYFTYSGATSGALEIVVDSEYNLFGINLASASYVYGGTWETSPTSSGLITYAKVRLANDVFDRDPDRDANYRFSSYAGMAMEEVVQAMGAGFDQVEYVGDTLHSDFSYYDKNTQGLPERDKNILRLLYSSVVSPGDPYYTVCRKLNLPKGCYRVPAGVLEVDAAMLMDPGKPYRVRVFTVDGDGSVSSTSAWQSMTAPARPANWAWASTVAKGGAAGTISVTTGQALAFQGSYLTAQEWNGFVERIGQFHAYKSISHPSSYYAAMKVAKGAVMRYATAADVRAAIAELSPPKALPAASAAGEPITAAFINGLKDSLNSVP